jgi:uncharacterized membrane protein
MRNSPLTFGEAMSTPVGLGLTVLSVFVLLYSVIIAGQILLGLLLIALLVSFYWTYRLFHALDGIADGFQRIADAQQASVERQTAHQSTEPQNETSFSETSTNREQS